MLFFVVSPTQKKFSVKFDGFLSKYLHSEKAQLLIFMHITA